MDLWQKKIQWFAGCLKFKFWNMINVIYNPYEWLLYMGIAQVFALLIGVIYNLIAQQDPGPCGSNQ